MMNSIGIRKYFGKQDAVEVKSVGTGDIKLTLWRAADGKEAIETNADPVLDTDANWDDYLEAFEVV